MASKVRMPQNMADLACDEGMEALAELVRVDEVEERMRAHLARRRERAYERIRKLNGYSECMSRQHRNTLLRLDAITHEMSGVS